MSWLRAFVESDRFFSSCGPCAAMGAAPRECALNMWACDDGVECCSCCSGQHAGTMLQVRRSSYHNVVKCGDVARLTDVAGIQSYTINGSKVVFLRRRPQPRAPKGCQGCSACTVCGRHLQDLSLYCSLQCKLDAMSGVKNVSLRPASAGVRGCAAGAGAAAMRVDANTNSSVSGAGGPDTPSRLAALHPLAGGGGGCSGSDSDGGSSAQSAGSRRKACPCRSYLD